MESALAAASYASDVRELHRRRTRRGNPQRETDIKIALERLKTSMRPLRTEIGRLQYRRPSARRDEQREVLAALSARLQAERRKLWKMQKRGTTK